MFYGPFQRCSTDNLGGENPSTLSKSIDPLPADFQISHGSEWVSRTRIGKKRSPAYFICVETLSPGLNLTDFFIRTTASTTTEAHYLQGPRYELPVPGHIVSVWKVPRIPYTLLIVWGLLTVKFLYLDHFWGSPIVVFRDHFCTVPDVVIGCRKWGEIIQPSYYTGAW